MITLCASLQQDDEEMALMCREPFPSSALELISVSDTSSGSSKVCMQLGGILLWKQMVLFKEQVMN